MKLLVKYPTRGRPVWFIKTLDMFMRMVSGKHEVEFLIAMDVDDPTMRTEVMNDYLIQIEPRAPSPITLTWYWKDHTGKVDAVNSCIASKDFNAVVVISDDIEPQEYGYDDIIMQSMMGQFPDFDGIIYFDDSRCHQRTVTIPIIGKPMYVRLGNIVHPAFLAWGDNFSTKVFKSTGKLAYFDRVLLKHYWGKYAHMDNTYSRAAHHRMSDARTFQQMWEKVQNQEQDLDFTGK